MSLPARLSPLSRNTRTRHPLSDIEYGPEILTLLASLRFATTNQIQRVVFDRDGTSARQARHRATRSLRRLFDSGYLRRVVVFAPAATSLRTSKQIVHVLSASGARAVGVDPRWVRNRAPGERQVLVHDYWLLELAVTAMEGCPEPLSILTWWDDRILSSRKRQGLLTLGNIPDGYLLIENLVNGKHFPCLIELDLGSASVQATTRGRRDFARKIEGYLEYVDGPFRREFGIAAPPVVLIVADSEQRLASLRATTRRLGGGGRYWFATLQRLRGRDAANGPKIFDFPARQGPFWTPNWQPAHEDGWRSLTARCGA